METTTRKQAVEAGAKTYFTGEPCRNGHLVERYTSSGTCKGCLADAQEGVRRALRGPRVEPDRLDQVEQLIGVRLRIHPADAATLLDTIVAMTLARRPALVAADVVGARKGTKPEGGTLLYFVNVDAADVQLVRDMQFAMLNARGPNVEAVRAQAFGGAMAQAEEARDNGETEWRFT